MKISLMATATVLAMSTGMANAEEIFIAALDDISGPTSAVGGEMAVGKSEAVKWINANGGINGKKIKYEVVDYAYAAPKAISAYKKWMSGSHKPALVFGYGTADTEALVGFITRDKVPYFSHSFSAKLTDPTGKSKYVKRAAPYNFNYGPSYSDGCRALVQWSADDWKKKNGKGSPKWIHLGANHPYPNSPKDACKAYAKGQSFEILPDIQYSMRGGDLKAQCLTLQQSGANYAYVANAAGSNIALLKSCETVGVKGIQFVSNVYGYDEIVMNAVGKYSDGIVGPVALAPFGSDVPGMALVKEISGGKTRTPHYVRAVCTMFLIKEALEWADKNGGLGADNIKKAMYQKKDWVPAGLEGVCLPSSYSATDHRGVDQVSLYKGKITDGKPGWEYLYTAKLPRTDEWFGR